MMNKWGQNGSFQKVSMAALYTDLVPRSNEMDSMHFEDMKRRKQQYARPSEEERDKVWERKIEKYEYPKNC